jgi:hypothetical protein
MSTKPETLPEYPFEDSVVTKKQLAALSANFFNKLQVMDNGRLRPIDCSDPSHPEKNDSRAVIFTKKNIDALFEANPGADGLKIYFGIHDHDIFPIPEENRKRYQNKLMAVLVTLTGSVENLNDDAGVAAKGMDNAVICPPFLGC